MSNDLSLYGDFTLEAAEEEIAAAKRRSSKIIRKLEAGTYRFRFLPPRAGSSTIFYESDEHYVELPGGKGTGFNCPREMAKQPCPVCRDVARLLVSANAGNAADADMVEKLSPRHYFWAAVIDRDDPTNTIKPFRFGKTVYEQLLGFRRKMNLNFSHPVSGIDIVITREGSTKNNTEYNVITNPEGRTRLLADDDAMLEMLTSIPNLKETVCRVPGEEEIQAILRGERPQLGGGAMSGIGVKSLNAGEQQPKRATDYVKR